MGARPTPSALDQRGWLSSQISEEGCKPSEQGGNVSRALSRAQAEAQSSIHLIQSLHLLTNSREHGTFAALSELQVGQGRGRDGADHPAGHEGQFPRAKSLLMGPSLVLGKPTHARLAGLGGSGQQGCEAKQ